MLCTRPGPPGSTEGLAQGGFSMFGWGFQLWKGGVSAGLSTLGNTDQLGWRRGALAFSISFGSGKSARTLSRQFPMCSSNFLPHIWGAVPFCVQSFVGTLRLHTDRTMLRTHPPTAMCSRDSLPSIDRLVRRALAACVYARAAQAILNNLLPP